MPDLISKLLLLAWVACRFLIVRPAQFLRNRVRGLQSHTDPRLATSRCTSYSRMSQWKQKFDSHSTAYQVLSGVDLTGRRVVVTGGSGGIGFEICRAACRSGASVVIGCRSGGQSAIERLRAETPGADVEAWHVDFTSLRSVLAFCRRYADTGRQLHALLLNAGVCGPAHAITEDGCETQFQVNHLSQLYLLRLLLPTLLKSSNSRVVLVSSESHRSTSVTRDTFDESHLNLLDERNYRGTGGLLQYGDTKLCNLLTVRHLHDRLYSRGLRFYAVHPGNMVNTGIQRQWWLSRIIFVLARPFTKTVSQAAATPVFAAFDKSADCLSGCYLNNCTPCQPSELARDPALAERLWQISDSMLRRRESEWLAESADGVGQTSPLDEFAIDMDE